ncbi:hypothetical protein GGR56DRAFT_670880 [Xylariaceae sp. FL0804]|nr:hypothetical protein GGR56DRAFT_670880 [Xylariaceae sp. FL0804]
MDTPDAEMTPALGVVFRGKRRKFYRQRVRPGDDDEDTTIHAQDAPTAETREAAVPTTIAEPDDGDASEEGLSVAEVLRRRNARKSRLRGVLFGAGDANPSATPAAGDEGDDELSLMIREEENRVLDLSSTGKQFAPQTGLTGELVNKHMEEYIELELAKRHFGDYLNRPTTTAAAARGPSSQKPTNPGRDLTESVHNKEPQKPTALLGKIIEVDLGDEMRKRNAAMTERAKRRLKGEAVDDEDDDDDKAGPGARSSKKVRLGRDGKPWRPRNRRTSDDIQRDRLVEDILHENKFDVYEAPPPPPATADNDEDGNGEDERAADDRVANKFRKDFLDAMAERRNKKKRPAQPRKPGHIPRKDNDNILKGPKLGGSRNTRAAMREILLKQAKEKKEGIR